MFMRILAFFTAILIGCISIYVTRYIFDLPIGEVSIRQWIFGLGSIGLYLACLQYALWSKKP
jgi:hypothetical protein